MRTSCGLILTDRKQILLCHPTGNDFWNIAKGIQNPDESTFQTCQREVEEETGLVFAPERYIALGHFKYLAGKELCLFLIYEPKLPEIGTLKCRSTFVGPGGVELPEHDAFEYATWEQAAGKVNTALVPVLESVQQEVNKFFRAEQKLERNK